MKLNLFVSLLLLSTLTLPSFAQEGNEKQSAGFLTLGYANLPTVDLKAFLDAGARNPNQNFFQIGTWNYTLKNKFFLGGSSNFLFGRRQTDNGISNKLFVADVLLNAGYAVVKTEKVRAYPLVGFGPGLSFFNIVPEESISAAQIATDPRREANLFLLSPVFDFGLGLDVSFKNKPGKEEKFALGLKIGYKLALDSSNWKYGMSTEVSDAPEYGPSGFYFSLLVGSIKPAK